MPHSPKRLMPWQLATGTFWVALDPTHVLVAKDTPENRKKFDRLLLETIFLPGLDKTELINTVNMIRNVFGVRQISSHAEHGTVTIRSTESTLRAINATVQQLYLDKPEVMLDVRVYQVNDSRQQDLGVAFPQTAERLQRDVAVNQHHQQQPEHDH